MYLNSAASPLARFTDARASAIDPVMTQPTEGESLYTYETEAGSISLSCNARYQLTPSKPFLSPGQAPTYRHLLLRQHYCAVLASYADGCDVRCGDRLECILCVTGPYQQDVDCSCHGGTLRTDLIEATLVGEDGNVSVETCAACIASPISCCSDRRGRVSRTCPT